MTPGITLLIVEDELPVAKDLVQKLKTMGYTISAVTLSGRAALAEAHDHPPDLVLMDIAIKGELDGIDTARQIYEQNNLPVIFLTATVDDALLTRAEQCGAYAYFLKPFREQELNATIRLVLRKHQQMRESANFRNTSTGLLNVAYLQETLSKEEARARRGQYPMGIIVVAIDQMELMRETYGAGVESYVLGELGLLLQKTVRTSDLICHYGPNKLLVLLPECSLAKTQVLAEKIRMGSYQLPLFYHSQQLWSTISLGVACYEDLTQPLAGVIQQGIVALAQAQTDGRNRVVLATNSH